VRLAEPPVLGRALRAWLEAQRIGSADGGLARPPDTRRTLRSRPRGGSGVHRSRV